MAALKFDVVAMSDNYVEKGLSLKDQQDILDGISKLKGTI
jgi:hypothetical protein